MFVYFNCLNYNESLFYALIKVIIHHLIKMTQRINNKHVNTDLSNIIQPRRGWILNLSLNLIES